MTPIAARLTGTLRLFLGSPRIAWRNVRWRLTRARSVHVQRDVSRFERIAGPELRALGYSTGDETA